MHLHILLILVSDTWKSFYSGFQIAVCYLCEFSLISSGSSTHITGNLPVSSNMYFMFTLTAVVKEQNQQALQLLSPLNPLDYSDFAKVASTNIGCAANCGGTRTLESTNIPS